MNDAIASVHGTRHCGTMNLLTCVVLTFAAVYQNPAVSVTSEHSMTYLSEELCNR